MVQFNLLPDVKLEYIKAERTRRLVLGISFIVSVAAIVLLVLLLSVDGLQKKHLSDLSKDITNKSNELQKKPDINTILTVQNQLERLTALHDAKPASARVFDYINSLTPAQVSINDLTVTFTDSTMKITGNADALSSVNKFVDTLKLTTYSTAENPNVKKPAFSDVVLTSFSLTTTNSKNKTPIANYTIDLKFDPTIFDTTQKVTLSVPSITTHAQLQTPTDVFDSSATGSKQ